MKITNEVKTALLAIVAIVLLIFGYSFLKGNNLLKSDRTFYAVYKNVEGLAKSSKVTVNGLKIGTVSNIRFLDNKGHILVTMTIQNDFKFGKGSTAQIYGGGFIGGKSMTILPSYKGEVAESGDTLKGDVEEGLLELVNDRLTPLQKKIENVVVSTDSLMNGFNQVLDNKTRNNLKSTIAELNSTMKSLNGAAGSVDHLLSENTSKIDRTFTNLDKMSGNFKKVSDSLSKVDIKHIVTKFDGVVSDFKQISADLKNGKGTAGKLLQDDKVYDNLDRATKQLEELLQDIKLNPKRYVHFSVFGKNGGSYKKPKDSLK